MRHCGKLAILKEGYHMRYVLLALSYVFAVPAIICGELSERLRARARAMEPPRDEPDDDWPSVRYDEWPADADRVAALSKSHKIT